MEQRQTWSSRLTYILTVAGATIGFGATWRFPYLVGQNGGGAYVLMFILVMLFVGIPIILVENVIGRRGRPTVSTPFCLRALNTLRSGSSSATQAFWVHSASCPTTCR